MTHASLARREFLRWCAAAPFGGVAALRGRWSPGGDERALVVLELQGGNDGLATVIPTDDASYARLRPTLAAVRRGAHALGDGTALHAALARCHRLTTEGRCAIVHGVGSPQPDRSHFRSRDVWYTADPTLQRVGADTTGWLGRAAERLAPGADGVPAAAIGQLEVPLVLHGRTAIAPSVRSLADFRWRGDADWRTLATSGGAGAAAFVADTARQALDLAGRLEQALARYRPHAEYPATALGRELQLAAQWVVSGFGTRFLHLGFGGFDTHARQLATHTTLLTQLDAALDAFVRDLIGHGRADSVAVLVHSEFGRRVAENASQGTDHGAAAPVFVLGAARAGVVGKPPDLTDLQDGDVRTAVDFRAIYTELLQWLGIDAGSVLGDAFAPAGLGLVR